jgi:hypothetical protein
MADMPSQDAEWATEDIDTFVDINGDGIDEVLRNKREPNPQWLKGGFLYGEKHPADYLNYQLNLIYLWQLHLKERYSVGDRHFTSSSETLQQISDRLGGDWELRGTETIAGDTVSVYRKIA